MAQHTCKSFYSSDETVTTNTLSNTAANARTIQASENFTAAETAPETKKNKSWLLWLLVAGIVLTTQVNEPITAKI